MNSAILLSVFVIILVFWKVISSFNKNNTVLSSLLTDNGFHRECEATPFVEDYIKSLNLSYHALDTIYRGSKGKDWDNNSWFLDINSGCEDPDTFVLLWKKENTSLPNFVIGRSLGIEKTSRIIRITTENIFKNFSLKLLPEEHQPFLSRKKGLLLYSNKNESLTAAIDNRLFEYINNPELNMSCMHYNGTMCCWTQGFSNFGLFFKTCTYIKNILK